MRNLYIGILVLFSSFFLSCENLLVKELDLEDFDFERQMVISGVIDNEKEEFIFYVSENTAITESFSGPEESAIPDATVSLFKDDELIGSPEYFVDGSVYFLSLNGIELVEGEYSVEVTAPTLPEVKAKTSIPSEVPLTQIEYIEDAGIHPETLERADAVKITFDDPEGANFYGLNIIANELGTVMDTFVIGTDTTFFEYTPFINIGSNDPDVFLSRNGFLLPDDFFEGREKSVTLFLDSFGFDISENKESIVVSWENLSEEKYLFTRSLELYQSSGDFGPFSEAVSVYTNVENGLGYFAGSHLSYYDLP